MSTYPRFETEARGNSEMAYSPHKTPVNISVMYVAGLQQSTGTSIVSALSRPLEMAYNKYNFLLCLPY